MADLSSPRIYQAYSPKHFKSYGSPLRNSYTGATHAYPNQGFLNGNRIPVKSMDDEWIPITNPHERLPVVSSSYKPVISKPIKSVGVPFKAPINSYGTPSHYKGAITLTFVKTTSTFLLHAMCLSCFRCLEE